MAPLRIAVIREGKQPEDRRTPITPKQAASIQHKYPLVKIVVQCSAVRCYSDEEYKREGIEVVQNVDDCEVLFGVKEVPKEQLLPGKTYFFFSHTVKKQPYNRDLLREILKRKIRLIDYECLTDEKGLRIIAFGRWAGIVGTYNAFWTYGNKFNLFELKRAYECHNLNELKSELPKISLPPVKIIITGDGRVARGGLEILEALGIKQVEPAPFFYQNFEEPVFTQVDVNAYYRHKDGHPFDFTHFFRNSQEYISDFVPFTHKADVFINAVFWDPRAPRLFSLDDMKNQEFTIKVIADITCDIDGSVPSTIRSCTIDDPVYDFDPVAGEKPPFSDEANVSVMAIDNLPNELPRDSSEDFGRQLMENVLPSLLASDDLGIIQRATIADKGALTERFVYLKDYVEGK